MPFVEQMTDPSPSDQPSLIQEMTIKGCEPHNGYDCGPTQSHTVTVTHCEIKRNSSPGQDTTLKQSFTKNACSAKQKQNAALLKTFIKISLARKRRNIVENHHSPMSILSIKKHDFNIKSFTVSLFHHHFPAHE